MNSGYYAPINPRTQMSHHVARIMHIKQIWTNNDFIFIQNLLGGPLETHVPLNDHQYTALLTGKISLVQVKDPIAGEVVHAGSQVLMRISPLLVYGQLLIGAVWILYLLGSVFFGGIVLILYWRGKITGRNKIGLGLWPFLASLLFLAVFLLPFPMGPQVYGKDPLPALNHATGRPGLTGPKTYTPWSSGMFPRAAGW